MKRNYKALVLVGVFALALWSFMPKSDLISDVNPNEKDKILLELIARVLENGHYNHVQFDDAFSKKLYKSYLETIDPNKRFFIASDIEEFSKYETQLDDQLLNKDLTFFDLTYNRLMQRMEESKAYYTDILSNPFDFSKDEDFDLDFEKHPYQASKEALKDKWRKQLQLSVLSKIYDKEKQQKGEESDIEEDLDLDANAAVEEKKKSTKTEIKTFEQLEQETRESELKTLNDYFDFIKDMDRNDWFSVYVNAITEQADPHTNYMAPDDKEKFDASMSGKFEGIGAKLMKKGDLIEVSELISGGPAWREGKLEAGDLITKVAQQGEDPVDISGMRMDNVIKMIKGKKGTKVILTVKRVDGSIVDIAITRDVVELEETYARSTIVNKGSQKFGIIYLPKFYFDIQDSRSRDAAKDVALEVERLKAEKVEGILIDLRDNGGGSLRTVVDMSGLFIERGPVVQVKNPSIRYRDGSVSDGKIEQHVDRDSSILWDGPLVVLVNNFSASASEIFAAAMQDYNRAIVIGSKQTYGKGTVQNFADLNNFVRNTDIDFGAIKITTQKFYRVNGGSTQLEGVKSDVVLPDRYMYIDMGERDMKSAMPWDEIPVAKFTPSNKPGVFKEVIEKSKKRVAHNPTYKLIDKNAKWISEQRNDYSFSLNYQKFAQKQEQVSKTRKEFNDLKKYKNNLVFKSLPYELDQIKNDSILGKKRERWHENLTKDIYVEEAINILEDLKHSKIGTLAKVKK